MNPTRRQVIASLFGLAAISAFPVSPLLAQESDEERFERLVRAGPVVNQVFYFRKPVVLHGLKRLNVFRCQFNLPEDFPGFPIVTDANCSGGIYLCYFRYGEQKAA